MKTPMSSDTKLTKDEEGEFVDNTKYRDMIGLELGTLNSTMAFTTLLIESCVHLRLFKHVNPVKTARSKRVVIPPPPLPLILTDRLLINLMMTKKSEMKSLPEPALHLLPLTSILLHQFIITCSKILLPPEQNADTLFNQQTLLLNCQQQMHEEQRGAFKTFGKALKGAFTRKKN
ncbi:hypothetical protein Tco_0184717 [Tanacetum coccineum]